MDVQVYEEVDQIIKTLQDSKWNAHSLQLLVSSQGKLAALLGNVNEDLGKARKEFDQAELHAKQVEANKYMENRKLKMTDNESKAQARLDSKNEWMSAIDAKNAYTSILGVSQAMQTLITACQVTIKNLGKEMGSAGY